MLDPSKSWKIDVDILRSPQYEALGQGNLYCDENDFLWSPVMISFDEAETTDAWAAQATHVLLLSKDGGFTWEITDDPWPGPPLENRRVLADGTIIETVTYGWERYPRSEIDRLRAEGYYVWDLGEKHDYCAVNYGMVVRHSTDGGQTWKEDRLHEKLPFFARFSMEALHMLDDGSLINFAYGYKPEGLSKSSELGGLSHAWCVRSTDGGRKWELIQIADGRFGPTARGFGENYHVVHGDGRIFCMLRTQMGHFAYSVWSSDGGQTWTEPLETPVRAKHPRVTLLRDGTVLCTYQRRFDPPFGVRARFTLDYGKTWTGEVVIRDDIPISDGLHQPNTVELSDRTLFTSFDAKKYDDEARGWPFVGGSRWTRSYKGPYGPKLEVPEAGEKYNYPRGG